jgi:aromatic ring-opening dioxygenase catalytic subunit (LigB family)
MQNNNNQCQVIYFSHGGGPLPILGDSSHQKMIQFMQTLPGKINKPEAIIVFSAHWEENIITIQSGAQPSMMYDYYGFPRLLTQLNILARGIQNLRRRRESCCKMPA